jgi:hypothetical protein
MEGWFRVRSNEALAGHLGKLLDPGESLLAFGLGTSGLRTVIVAATDRRLLIERIGIGFRRRELASVPYGFIEAIEGRKGDSSAPSWAKMSLQSSLGDRMTTSVLLKRPGEQVMHLRFRALPTFRGNGGKGLEIADAVAVGRPGIRTMINLKEERGEEQGCLARGFGAGILSGVFFGAMGFFSAGTTRALAGAFLFGFCFGAVIAPIWTGIRRQWTGRG